MDPADTPAALLQLLWTELADVIGSAATATVLRRAVGRAADSAPGLAELTIHRDRFQYRYAVPPTWDAQSETTMESMRQLMRELRPLLLELTGMVVLRRLDQIPAFQRTGLTAPEERQ
jgi:hypothetical protein